MKKKQPLVPFNDGIGDISLVGEVHLPYLSLLSLAVIGSGRYVNLHMPVNCPLLCLQL
jgi:hypothetical protein